MGRRCDPLAVIPSALAQSQLEPLHQVAELGHPLPQRLPTRKAVPFAVQVTAQTAHSQDHLLHRRQRRLQLGPQHLQFQRAQARRLRRRLGTGGGLRPQPEPPQPHHLPVGTQVDVGGADELGEVLRVGQPRRLQPPGLSNASFQLALLHIGVRDACKVRF